MVSDRPQPIRWTARARLDGGRLHRERKRTRSSDALVVPVALAWRTRSCPAVSRACASRHNRVGGGSLAGQCPGDSSSDPSSPPRTFHSTNANHHQALANPDRANAAPRPPLSRPPHTHRHPHPSTTKTPTCRYRASSSPTRAHDPRQRPEGKIRRGPPLRRQRMARALKRGHAVSFALIGDINATSLRPTARRPRATP